MTLPCVAIRPEMLDEAACRAWVIRRFHPAGAFCPFCGCSPSGVQIETFHAGGRLHCKGCGKWYTARTATPLDRSTMDWRQFYLLVSLIGQGGQAKVIAEMCGVCDDTVRVWQRRLKGEM